MSSILVDNNAFVSGKSQDFFAPFKDAQHPRATVVMCADSRVHTHAFENTPDGDLFVIRNIGNQVLSNRGSVEYGVRHLHTPLLLIIGHVACGAVKAALGDYRGLSNDIREPLDRLHLALDTTRTQPQSESQWRAGIEENVHYQVNEDLTTYAEEVKAGKLTIVGAVYDFQDLYGLGRADRVRRADRGNRRHPRGRSVLRLALQQVSPRWAGRRRARSRQKASPRAARREQRRAARRASRSGRTSSPTSPRSARSAERGRRRHEGQAQMEQRPRRLRVHGHDEPAGQDDARQQSSGMRHAALLVFAAIVCAACAPADTTADGRGGDDDDDAAEDLGVCPAPPVGVTLEETAPPLPGDDPAASGDGGDGVVVLMGGGSEVDRAAARFVDGARGGEVLVLRASGSSSSYTAYFADELASEVRRPARAVATVRIDDPQQGAADSVLCRVRRAEALWFAGGDQSDYLVRWPEALHEAIAARIAKGAAVGGTSAGAMSLSAFAFDARDGGVTSDEAIDDPLAPSLSVTPSPFPAVADVVIDTHFSAREREGRLLAFMARAGEGVRGVGLDEQTALVIDGDTAQVLADDGGSAFVYEATGVRVDDGLDMARLVRRAIGDGEALVWPAVLDDGEVFRVDNGVLAPVP